MPRFGEKSLKDKAVGGLRKVFMAAIAATGIGGFGYYHYGTLDEVEAKIISQDSGYKWNDGAEEASYNYTFKTSKGTFIDEPSRMHFKSKDDAAKIWADARNGETYRIKYYGVDFGPFQRNITDITLVTEEELKARAAEKERIAKEKKAATAANAASGASPGTAATPAAGQPAAPVATPAQAGALSGRVTTLDLLSSDGKNQVQVTVPVEAAGRVIVNSVTPLQPAPPVAAPAAPKP